MQLSPREHQWTDIHESLDLGQSDLAIFNPRLCEETNLWYIYIYIYSYICIEMIVLVLCGCHSQLWLLNDTKWGDEELSSNPKGSFAALQFYLKATTREWKWKTDLSVENTSEFAGSGNHHNYTLYISSIDPLTSRYMTHTHQHTNIEMTPPHLPSRDRVCEPIAANSPGGQAVKHQHVTLVMTNIANWDITMYTR